MDRAEEAFDAILPGLEKHNFTKWSNSEVGVLLSLVEQYYKSVSSKSRGAKNEAADGEATVSCEEDEECDDDSMEQAVSQIDRDLTRLRGYLKKKLPYGSMQEPATRPYDGGDQKEKAKAGQVVCTPPLAAPSLALDAFLYLDEDIEEMVNGGIISREYCRCCGSTEVGLVDFITHSFSQDQLVFLSSFLLPMLTSAGGKKSGKPKTVVDVGSRLGVVLWSCYYAAQQGLLTNVSQAVGVELDAQFVTLQREIGKRYCPRPVPVAANEDDDQPTHTFSCNVLESNCFEGEGASALRSADVIILHNVFEYFCKSPEEHLACWQKLRRLVTRPGQLLVISPGLEETFAAFDGVASASSSQKRPRGGDKAAASLVNEWLENYVEKVDISLVSQAFIQFRALERASAAAEGEGGCCGDDCNDSHCHSHGSGGGDCGPAGCGDANEGEDEENGLPELDEQIGSLHVYRVR